MISAETIKEIAGYTITAYTYSADVSATGEELTTYEVTNEDSTVFEAFDELEEAVDFVENQTVWERLINILPPHPQIVAY